MKQPTFTLYFNAVGYFYLVSLGMDASHDSWPWLFFISSQSSKGASSEQYYIPWYGVLYQYSVSCLEVLFFCFILFFALIEVLQGCSVRRRANVRRLSACGGGGSGRVFTIISAGDNSSQYNRSMAAWGPVSAELNESDQLDEWRHSEGESTTARLPSTRLQCIHLNSETKNFQTTPIESGDYFVSAAELRV